jgi:hypothetical protein
VLVAAALLPKGLRLDAGRPLLLLRLLFRGLGDLGAAGWPLFPLRLLLRGLLLLLLRLPLPLPLLRRRGDWLRRRPLALPRCCPGGDLERLRAADLLPLLPVCLRAAGPWEGCAALTLEG